MTRPLESKRRSRVQTGGVALAMLATTYVGGKEGLKLYAYQDVIGVWTACYGETRGIRKGMTFTKPECDQMLLTRLDEFGQGIEACVPVLADESKVGPKRYVAHLSLAYNIGLNNYCNKSSVARLTKAGFFLEGCDAFLKWNRAGGVPIRGLTDRRKQERAFCRENG